MENFIENNNSVYIKNKEYKLHELSLAQKIKVIEPVADFIKELAHNVFLKKDSKGGIKVDIPEEISLAELNIDKILMGSINILPEILKLSVPQFKDWDSLSETETREPLAKALEINDFTGFITNFISLAGRAIRLPKQS